MNDGNLAEDISLYVVYRLRAGQPNIEIEDWSVVARNDDDAIARLMRDARSRLDAPGYSFGDVITMNGPGSRVVWNGSTLAELAA